VLLTLPFFDRRSKRSLVHRPLALAALVGVLGGSGLLIGAALRNAPPLQAEPNFSEAGLTSVQRAGLAVFKAQQCAGCHRINSEGGEVGPDLSALGLRHDLAWLHSFVENPSRFRKESIMPAFGPPRLTHEEIEEVAQYLSTLRAGAPPGFKPEFHDTLP